MASGGAAAPGMPRAPAGATASTDEHGHAT
jgi:hypothetical protein